MSTHQDRELITDQIMVITAVQFGEVMCFIWITYRHMSERLLTGEERTQRQLYRQSSPSTGGHSAQKPGTLHHISQLQENQQLGMCLSQVSHFG